MGGNSEPESGLQITCVGDVVFGADAQIGRWVAQRIPNFVFSQGAKALGVIRNGEMAAGVVFDRWNGVNIEASIAAEPQSGWATRQTLRVLFTYPFVTLGCQAITLCVAQSNLQSLNLATKLGFQPEALIKFAAHDGSALVVLKMFQQDCRWISDGKEERQRAEAARPASDGSSRGAIQPA